MAAHDDLRKYFPGDFWSPKPEPVFIITVTVVRPGSPPETVVLDPERTRLNAEARADLVRLDILEMAYKALPHKYVLTHQDELFAELQETQTVLVQVHERTLPPRL
jgi:hypothetical protein